MKIEKIKEKNFMDKFTLCKILGVGVEQLDKNYLRMQQKFEKRGILISKSGRGKNAEYNIKILRAPSLFLEEKDNEQTYLTNDQLSFTDWELLVFIGICSGELPVYWGYYKDFLNYVGVNNTEENVELLKEALRALEDKYNLIQVTIDKTCNNTFTASITRATHTKVKDNLLYMIKKCKELQNKYNKRSWLTLLRVWLIADSIQDECPHTYDELLKRSGGGVTKNAIKTSLKILEDEGVLTTELVYDRDEEMVICYGKKYRVYEFLPELKPNDEEQSLEELEQKIAEYGIKTKYRKGE